jgi:hypothetical protein
VILNYDDSEILRKIIAALSIKTQISASMLYDSIELKCIRVDRAKAKGNVCSFFIAEQK